MRKIQAASAGVLVLFTVVATALTVYLAFFFPKTAAIWQQQGRALSIVETLALRASQFCVSLGIFILPLLLVFLLGALAWLAFALASGDRSETLP